MPDTRRIDLDIDLKDKGHGEALADIVLRLDAGEDRRVINALVEAFMVGARAAVVELSALMIEAGVADVHVRFDEFVMPDDPADP